MPHRLIPTFQTYPWGDDTFIQDLCSLEDLEGTPVAEMWLGAHPKAPSLIEVENKQISLLDYIHTHTATCLGEASNISQDSLPFLFKVLAAKEPLSIQVHPDKQTAERGFAEENNKGIALDDPTRSFKDDNHKPELMCALTDFSALCGFREYAVITANFHHFDLTTIWEGFTSFTQHPCEDTLRELFRSIMTSSENQLQDAHTRILKTHSDPESPVHELRNICLSLAETYPFDPGIISPLLLNVIHLKAFDAIYIEAGIMHAYLNGAGLELMANSDNVIRGGLSPKHIDLERLLKISNFQPYQPKWVPASHLDASTYLYPTPAKEFKLMLLELRSQHCLPTNNKPMIVLCLHGTVSLDEELMLGRGESAFIGAEESNLCCTGNALLAIATL